MKKTPYLANILLTGILGICCSTLLVILIFQPLAVLPRLTIPMLVAMTTVSLSLVFLLDPEQEDHPVVSGVLAALSFGCYPC